MKCAHRIEELLALTLLLLVVGCSPAAAPKASPSTASKTAKTAKPDSTADKAPADSVATEAETQQLVASVAASTIDVMQQLADEFHKGSPEIELKLNPGPSNALAQQIIEGAPADLFISANEKWAAEVAKAGRAAESVPLLTNDLVIVVPAGNPAEVNGPDDLLSEKVKKVALAGEQVPAGMYADQALKALGLDKKLAEAGKIVRGQDVRATLTYVARGEAEAGVVYSTDVASAPEVKVVHKFDPKLHDKIVYVLVLLRDKEREPSSAAREFFEFLQSKDAEPTFARFNFQRIGAETAEGR